jgi:hypothetical protein
MAISKKSWLAIAREVTPGTAPASPTLFIPTKSIMKGTQHFEYLDEERGDRNANYDRVATLREGSTDPKGPWYNDVGGYWLLGAMGSDTATQPDSGHAPTVYKHTFALADVPPSFTVWKSYDAKVYSGSYAVVEKLAFKWTSAKLLEKEVSLKHLFPVPQTGPFTPTFSTLKPFAGYAPTITLTGGSTTDIDEFDITFEQKITLWYPSSGSQDFTTVYFGERKVTGGFTARFDNTTVFDRWRQATDDTLTVDFQGTLIVNSGASGTPPNQNYFQELNINCPVIGYDSAEHDLGKDNVLFKAKFTARPSTGQNLINAFIQNTVASYTN